MDIPRSHTSLPHIYLHNKMHNVIISLTIWYNLEHYSLALPLFHLPFCLSSLLYLAASLPREFVFIARSEIYQQGNRHLLLRKHITLIWSGQYRGQRWNAIDCDKILNSTKPSILNTIMRLLIPHDHCS